MRRRAHAGEPKKQTASQLAVIRDTGTMVVAALNGMARSVAAFSILPTTPVFATEAIAPQT